MIKTMTANQKMAELFQRNKSTISRHIFYVFESGEPKQDPCSAKFAIQQFLQPRRKRLLRSGARQPGRRRYCSVIFAQDTTKSSRLINSDQSG